MTEARRVQVTGVLVPLQWTTGGTTLEIGLQATDEQEYLLETKSLGQDLVQLERKRVAICGELSRQDGKNILRVESFEIIYLNGTMD